MVTKILMRTMDTDIYIGVAMFTFLQIEELWIAFGTGKYFRYIPVHSVMIYPKLYHSPTHSQDVTQFLHFMVKEKKTMRFGSYILK